jgi:hypothetical protein
MENIYENNLLVIPKSNIHVALKKINNLFPHYYVNVL